jgi:hypothetical protein
VILTLQSLGIDWPTQFLGPLIILIFAVIASWIAFSPGERSCSGTASFLGSTLKSVNSCTIPFSISAVLCWVFFLFTVVVTIKSRRK